MFLKSQRSKDRQLPEKLRYSQYYEHDGALRAYANRAMLTSAFSALLAFVALGYAIHIGLKPVTVIQVDANGQASVVGRPMPITVVQDTEAEPSDLEKTAFVKLFLDRYLNFSPSTVSGNWAGGMNMMALNLRRTAMNRMKEENTIGEIIKDQTRSEFTLGPLEKSDKDPLMYIAHGVKTVHHIHDHSETMDKIVSEFRIRLAVEKRSEENPSGLLIAEYAEQQIDGEKRGQMFGQADSNTK